MAGFLAAFVALLPAVLRGRPRGRRVPALRALAPEVARSRSVAETDVSAVVDASAAVDAAPAEQALPR